VFLANQERAIPNPSSSDEQRPDSSKPTAPSSGNVAGGAYDDPAKARLREQRAQLAAEEQRQRDTDNQRAQADRDQRAGRDRELEQQRMEAQLWEMDQAKAEEAASEFQREEQKILEQEAALRAKEKVKAEQAMANSADAQLTAEAEARELARSTKKVEDERLTAVKERRLKEEEEALFQGQSQRVAEDRARLAAANQQREAQVLLEGEAKQNEMDQGRAEAREAIQARDSAFEQRAAEAAAAESERRAAMRQEERGASRNTTRDDVALAERMAQAEMEANVRRGVTTATSSADPGHKAESWATDEMPIGNSMAFGARQARDEFGEEQRPVFTATITLEGERASFGPAQENAFRQALEEKLAGTGTVRIIEVRSGSVVVVVEVKQVSAGPSPLHGDFERLQRQLDTGVERLAGHRVTRCSPVQPKSADEVAYDEKHRAHQAKRQEEDAARRAEEAIITQRRNEEDAYEVKVAAERRTHDKAMEEDALRHLPRAYAADLPVELFDRNGKGRKEKKIQRWLWLSIEENDLKLCSEAIRQGGGPPCSSPPSYSDVVSPAIIALYGRIQASILLPSDVVSFLLPPPLSHPHRPSDSLCRVCLTPAL